VRTSIGLASLCEHRFVQLRLAPFCFLFNTFA
jgi:hypothetical protein